MAGILKIIELTYFAYKKLKDEKLLKAITVIFSSQSNHGLKRKDSRTDKACEKVDRGREEIFLRPITPY